MTRRRQQRRYAEPRVVLSRGGVAADEGEVAFVAVPDHQLHLHEAAARGAGARAGAGDGPDAALVALQVVDRGQGRRAFDALEDAALREQLGDDVGRDLLAEDVAAPGQGGVEGDLV